MHKEIIKKFTPGGSLAYTIPTPPSLSSLTSGVDMTSNGLELLPSIYKNPYTSKSIFGKNFLFNNQNNKISQLFNNYNLNSTMSLAGGLSDSIGKLIPQKEQSALTTGLNQGYDAAANAAMAIPGVGTIIGGAMKVGGMLSDGLTALGVGTDQMTTTDKILDSKFLKLTPVGIINAIGAKKANTIYKDNEAFEQVGASYGGVSNKVDNALTKSGKKYGLFSNSGLKKANAEIAEAKRQQGIMSNIADNAKDAFTVQSSMTDINNKKYAFQLSGGYQNSLRVGQKGLKFPTLEQIERAKRVSRKQVDAPALFKEGGKMNVIPEGALHARLHHMDMEGITKKGIPVITKEEGGEIVQHAEIERDEIIFTKEVTEKLEELYKKGTDEAAIEAGKILAREIMENTQDNTGLMQTIS